jgi:hypothetical protein
MAQTGTQISDEQLKKVCKIGQGKDCCRYILCGGEGFHCAKLDPDLKPIKDNLDQRAASGNMVAQSDNCEGLS